MTTFIALLRAVNVGGTGKLAMADLKSLCVEAGFARVETYIASGNVIFDSQETAERVQATLESRLHAHTRKPIDVFVRTASDMKAILRANPFPTPEQKNIYVFFLRDKPPKDATTNVLRQTNEEIRAGKREIYVHYPVGMGTSKLSIPAAKHGTARNLNTVSKLVAMTATKR
jgi:uncharacterized protein (DUF1697 family)